MAAQAPLLLLTLICNIQAEVIRRAGESHHFSLDQTADFCSVSRWTSEGKELLWNSSGSSYRMFSLNGSHSGQYQEQCWIRGNLTLERNSTLLVCDDHKMRDHETLYPDIGRMVELTCDSVGPNQSAQWAYEMRSTNGLVSIQDQTPPVYEHQRVKKEPSRLLVTADQHSEDITYYCLEQRQQRCELHSRFYVRVAPAFIFRSVGESLELNCSDVRGSQTHKWRIYNALWPETESLNLTLMFPSLTLGHTGGYHCDLGASALHYTFLFVCPEPEPPAVVLFTGGENLTLPCGDWNRADSWFMRTNRTGGRATQIYSYKHEWQQYTDNVYLSESSLPIRNVSLQDSGTFWCVQTTGDRCVLRSETLVMFGEPEVDHHLVRSVLLSVVTLMMLCTVVVWRSRRREQLPAAVEELEMSQLSPESDLQEETPV